MNNPNSPSRVIVWFVAVTTLLAGLLVLTPWYLPPEAAGLFAGIARGYSPITASVLTCLAGLPGIVGIFRGYKWTKAGAMTLFAFYLFNTLSRILIIGEFWNLTWVLSAILSGIMAIIYLWNRRSNG
jgi:hypothetical protein